MEEEREFREHLVGLSVGDDIFLTALTEAAKLYGWTGDYTEIVNFVNWCFDLVKKPRPNLDPYEFDEGDLTVTYGSFTISELLKDTIAYVDREQKELLRKTKDLKEE
jgi:hypothetical protein